MICSNWVAKHKLKTIVIFVKYCGDNLNPATDPNHTNFDRILPEFHQNQIWILAI